MPKRTATGDDAPDHRLEGQRRKVTVSDPVEELPYAVELWGLTRMQVERVLGRASSLAMARAIFEAAKTEHLGRRITLSKDGQVLLQGG